ncbi:MAG: substrate-binding domain-containing protein [Proteobacteria bacterium]|nr:substrate-binding domain-containing protein [Pseudomonadota bacterium]MBU1736852.1 substrate-binding domain-containing protein [Pseudomonadota bacterium]
MKKLVLGAMLGASLLAMASTASAAVEINIFGASAQNDYWNTAAPLYLAAPVANGGMGCDPATVAKANRYYDKGGVWTKDKKMGIAKGDNCAGAGGDTVYIQYTAVASFEGPRSVYGVDPDNLDSCSDNPAYDDHYREMIDETSCDFAIGECSAKACKDVTIGASDVAAESFTQSSTGCINGHVDCSEVLDISLTPDTIPTAGLDTYRPIVVPFRFFVSDNLATAGINNLTRLQAVLLFNGNVTNWSQFGPSYPNLGTVICLRHAGSGTHATLDKAVMRGDYPLASVQIVPPPFNPTGQVIYFNESSSNLMDCVNDLGGKSAATHGAVGYADADKNAAGTWPNVVNVTYNGVDALQDHIKNGVYSFWSAQWIYEDPTEPNYAVTHPIVQSMMAYSSIAANIPASKAPYWVAKNDLNVTKGTDFVLPKF